VHLPLTAVDVLLAAATALYCTVVITADLRGPGDRPIDWIGCLLVPALAGLLLIRRRPPAAVLLTSVGVLLLYYAAGYPPVGLELPLAGAFFSTAEAGRIRLAVTTGTILVAFAYIFRIADGQDASRLLGYELPSTIVILAGAIAAGDALRSRRRQRREDRKMAELAAQNREQEALRIVESERNRIARDVHDVLGHTVAIIQLQAGIASETMSDDPATADEALTHIATASRSAMDELQFSLARLRSGQDESREPVLGINDLDALTEHFTSSGITTTLRRRGETHSVPAATDSTVYRVAQEALTNTARHSTAAHITLDVDVSAHQVCIDVHDDGHVSGDWYPGNGIIGMRERVALLGGTLSAGPRGDGFHVHATIPLTRSAVQT